MDPRYHDILMESLLNDHASHMHNPSINRKLRTFTVCLYLTKTRQFQATELKFLLKLNMHIKIYPKTDWAFMCFMAMKFHQYTQTICKTRGKTIGFMIILWSRSYRYVFYFYFFNFFIVDWKLVLHRRIILGLYRIHVSWPTVNELSNIITVESHHKYLL